MRDHADNCVIICGIENVDPMGVHTGDSITVAPIQTLTDVEYQQMRDAAIACIRRVGVETGGSNVQFAVDPADRPPGRHRDEPACVAQLGARVEGDRIPDREDRREARDRLHPRRDPERHHRDPGVVDAGVVRAGHRLRRDEDPAVGVREAARHHGRARHADAVGRRGDGDRAHVPRESAEGAPLAGAGSTRSELRPRRGGVRIDDRRRTARGVEDPDAAPAAPGRRPDPAWHPDRDDPRGDQDRPVVPRSDGADRRGAGGARDHRHRRR